MTGSMNRHKVFKEKGGGGRVDRKKMENLGRPLKKKFQTPPSETLFLPSYGGGGGEGLTRQK